MFQSQIKLFKTRKQTNYYCEGSSVIRYNKMYCSREIQTPPTEGLWFEPLPALPLWKFHFTFILFQNGYEDFYRPTQFDNNNLFALNYFFKKHRSFVAWENSWHFAMPMLVSPQNDIGKMGTEIPYWRLVTTQIWEELLIGWKFASSNQKHYPDLGSEIVISMEFLRSFLRLHFTGKPLKLSQNVGYFLSSFQVITNT